MGGVVLRAKSVEKASHAFPSTHPWEMASVSIRHPFKESPNEDQFAVIPLTEKRLVLAVADGCGGLANGHLASQRAIAILQEHLTHSPNLDPTLAVWNAFEEANRQVLGDVPGGGTTLTVAVLDDQNVRTIHVGDSRAWIVDATGVRFQTMSHSPVGYGQASGLLSEHKAFQSTRRHIVDNVIGSAEMRIDIGPWIQMRPQDRLVLASDGLFDNLKQNEIVKRVCKAEPATGLERLTRLARQRMQGASTTLPCKPDDLTVIVAKYRQGLPRKRSAL